MNRWRWILGLGLGAVVAAQGHDSKFVFVAEPTVPGEGEVEIEQWITGRFGRDGGSYSAWDFREEVEYGMTKNLAAALYLNFTDEFWQPDGSKESSGGGLDFTGVSLETKYQFTDPESQALGSLLYLEYTTDGSSHELEEKLVLGKAWSRWRFALNAITEQEWEYEDGSKLEEGTVEFSGGIAHHIAPGWSAGVEARHKIKYADAALSQREYAATYAGPNVTFEKGNVRVIFAVMPQLRGSGEGVSGGLQLDEEERLQTRLIASYEF